MNVSCDHCSTIFRVDPRKVPDGGVNARCSVCHGVFLVRAEALAGSPLPPSAGEAREAGRPEEAAPPPPSTPPPAPAEAQPVSAPSAPPVPFGASDPQSKARRLARALISDIAVYHPERRDRSLADGTLRQEFREEIRKSWEEYVDQVGEEISRTTPYFRDALNEILARGQRLF